MKPIKAFDEFIKQGIVKRHSPDISRAEFLVNESKNTYEALIERVTVMGITNKNANSIAKECYDSIMEVVRASMLRNGMHASGMGAHEAEVAYMRNLGLSETDVQFADRLRYFRNGMLYYGTIVDKEYAQQALEFTKRIYPKLKRRVT